MARFVDRQREFQELDQVLQEPGAHFVVVYGRVERSCTIEGIGKYPGIPYPIPHPDRWQR